MAYADYEYYVCTYGGNLIPEADFPRLVRLASYYLDEVTLGRAEQVTEERIRTRLQDACCAVAEEYLRQEQGGELASATNDGYAETYVSSGKTTAQKLYSIALQFLGVTGLLYTGGG